ncbi:hypothetical protein ACFL35_17640 [Candidatus Riflebacteria bacterium]
MNKFLNNIFFIGLGIYCCLIAWEIVSVSKNEAKNKEWLTKYGIFFKISGPCLIVLGILAFFLF